MNSEIDENMGRALRMLLKPVARLLLAQGISHKSFAEAAKEVFVEIALREQEESKKLVKSRVAIVTGLTRKEVTNVIDKALNEDAPARNFSRPGKVLNAWYNDPQYVTPYGVPMEIPYDIEGEPGAAPSFVHLVKAYSGDQSPLQMLDELLRVGAIKQLDDGHIKVLRRGYEPASLSPKMIQRFGEISYDLLTTLAINVRKEAPGYGVFDRAVVSDQPMTAEELEQFRDFLQKRGQDMLVELDQWLTMNVTKKPAGQTVPQVFNSGVAMIHFITARPEERDSLRDFLIKRRIDEKAEDVD